MLNPTIRPPAVWRTLPVGFVRSALRNPRALLAIGTLAIAGGVAANWSWMVAIGAAPVLLGLLPCAAMCALGLCMPMGGRKIAPVVETKGNSGAPLIEGTVNRLSEGVGPVTRAATPSLRRSNGDIGAGDDHSCCAATEEKTPNA